MLEDVGHQLFSGGRIINELWDKTKPTEGGGSVGAFSVRAEGCDE
jgi:formiminotetrahydrofolate cyclodeaminase